MTKIIMNTLISAVFLCIPLGIILVFITGNGYWAVLSVIALIFFMAG